MTGITPAQRAIIGAILKAKLPEGAAVSVFGSRATDRTKPYSDLDLLIDAGRRLNLDEMAALADAFSESDLPWKVDLLDRHAADPSFLRIIEPQCMKFDA